MTRCAVLSTAFVLLACPAGTLADDPIFSGPQAGEKLPAFQAQGVFGELAGKEFDPIGRADGGPVAIVFVHQRTRPAFGLTNTVMRHAATRAEDGLHSAVIFLTDDPTSMRQWMERVKQHLPEGVVYGMSADGAEGPGAYRLNRNVTLTVLVGKQGQATANFPLVQPSLPADGPKILQAIVEAVGSGEVPDIAELGGRRSGEAPQRMRRGVRQWAKKHGEAAGQVEEKPPDEAQQEPQRP